MPQAPYGHAPRPAFSPDRFARVIVRLMRWPAHAIECDRIKRAIERCGKRRHCIVLRKSEWNVSQQAPKAPIRAMKRISEVNLLSCRELRGANLAMISRAQIWLVTTSVTGGIYIGHRDVSAEYYRVRWIQSTNGSTFHLRVFSHGSDILPGTSPEFAVE